MALNSNYVPLTPLWEVFTDKDLLTFLSDGYVKFFIDTERTVGKPVYQLTGSPPNYTYTQYGFLDTDGSWRVNMNLQGAFDQVIYGYPLDADGNVQLYFAQFYSSDGVFQFSREGFPNFFAPGGSLTTPIDINFIPDGQFRLHTDIPETDTLKLGQVRDPITQIAFGGWTFERPDASTARDFVTFQRIGSFVTNPVKSPRYAVEITCEAPNAGDTFKDLRVKFDDVNKFASDTDMYTFGITGKVVSSGSIDVELVLIKNFGTGGDVQTETNLTTFTITNTFTQFFFPFVFGNNTGKIIGPGDDDFVQIALRMPANELFDVEFTDALLTPGDVMAPTFNDTTTREFLYESLFDDTKCPAFDGSDIGLPLVLTKYGLRFDDAQVGMIFATGTPIGFEPFGYIPADGIISYDTTLHSSDGIPYSRLASKYLVPVTVGVHTPIQFNSMIFGSGPSFLTAQILNTLDLKISTNTAGASAGASEGSNPTGFTFKSIKTGDSTIEALGYSTSDSTLYIENSSIGVVTVPDVSSIGATSSVIINGSLARAIVSIKFTSVVGSQYFTFLDAVGTKYVVWYKVDGAGTPPSIPGAVFIEIDIYTGVSTQDIANITADAISGKQISDITTVAASAIPQSAFFNIGTLTQSYYVWYNKGGTGTDPAIVGKVGIQVFLTGSETKDQVTAATASAINTRYFATPDLRGIFLKGATDVTIPSHDLASTMRYAKNSILWGGFVGSREFSDNISHNHLSPTDANTEYARITSVTRGLGADTPVLTDDDTLSIPYPIGYQGSSESRPENIYVNYVVKY